MQELMTTIRKSRRITLKDVAERAKVSVAAASMALADHPEISPRTKDRVLEVSRRLGYATRREVRAAAGLGARDGLPVKQQRFGFLLIGGRLEDEAFAGMLHALLVGAANLDVRVEVSAVEDAGDIKAVAERTMAYAKDLSGLILMGEAHPTLLDELHRASIPHTVIGYVPGEYGEPLSTPVQIVTTDEEAMGRRATSALLEAGHRRIGFICERLIPGLMYERWLGGYALAHLSKGLSLDATLVQNAREIHVGGRPAAEAFSKMSEPPTAFVVPDARTAASFLQAMRDRGVEVKPSDIVVGGQDFVVKRYGLEGYPQVLEDLPKMASIALEHLRGLCRHPAVHAAEILVPFATRNLPTR
jgi:LacI family transcriptional regulator